MQSRILHKSGHYTACLIKIGLTVQSNRVNHGRLLPANDPRFQEWLDAIETAIDSREADDLCAALVQG